MVYASDTMVFVGVWIFAFLLECHPGEGIGLPVKPWRAEHWSNSRPLLDDAGLKTISKSPEFHLKERQAFTNRFGCPTPAPATDHYGSPILVPKPNTHVFPTPAPATDHYGSPILVPKPNTHVFPTPAPATDHYGSPILVPKPNTHVFPTPAPATDHYGSSILVPKTDTYGSPYTDSQRAFIPKSYLWIKTKRYSRRLRSLSRCGYLITSSTSHPPPSTVVTAIATNPQQSRALQPQAMIDTMTYGYIGAGVATLLLVTVVLILLAVWAQKRKNRQRVINIESL